MPKNFKQAASAVALCVGLGVAGAVPAAAQLSDDLLEECQTLMAMDDPAAIVAGFEALAAANPEAAGDLYGCAVDNMSPDHVAANPAFVEQLLSGIQTAAGGVTVANFGPPDPSNPIPQIWFDQTFEGIPYFRAEQELAANQTSPTEPEFNPPREPIER